MLKRVDTGCELTEIASGFGSPEALAIIDGNIILSSYRGHAHRRGQNFSALTLQE